MDGTEELEKDIQDAPVGSITHSGVLREESSPIDPEEEQHNLKKYVKLQSEELDDVDIESPIDNHSLVEDGNIDASADANSNDHANVNKHTNLKVDANVSIAEDGSRDNAVGNIHAACVDANISVDASLEAGANMNSHFSMDADANTSANAEIDANTEFDADPNIEGNAKMEVDGDPKTDAINNSNANTDLDANAAGQHDAGVFDGYIFNPSTHLKSDSLERTTSESKSGENDREEQLKIRVNGTELLPCKEIKDTISQSGLNGVDVKALNQSFLWDSHMDEGSESGSEVEQAAFMDELESFFKERSMDFKPPKFYGEGLNLLKLWRAVTRLGGYDRVTSCKLWRQVGESFKPPKTCTTVSWTFRCFYEKALLEYEKSKMNGGELSLPDASFIEPSTAGNQVSGNPSGRARRDAAARAMQGWHSQRLLGNGEVGDPIIKDKNPSSSKREKQLKSIGLLKRKKPSTVDRAVKAARLKVTKPQLDTVVVDIGSPADWVKVNVQRTKDCFEVYALVPGLLREEVRVQSDPAGRLVISGLPEQLDNPWGVTPFKKVVSLPSRIDPHQTSAVVTLHGQLFVRVPFEQ